MPREPDGDEGAQGAEAARNENGAPCRLLWLRVEVDGDLAHVLGLRTIEEHICEHVRVQDIQALSGSNRSLKRFIWLTRGQLRVSDVHVVSSSERCCHRMGAWTWEENMW